MSPDGRRLYHPSSDGDVLVFDTHGGRGRVERRDEHVRPLLASSSGGGGVGGGGVGGGVGGGGGRNVRNVRRGGPAARGGRRGGGGGGRGRGGGAEDEPSGPRPHATLKGHLAAVWACVVHPDTQVRLSLPGRGGVRFVTWTILAVAVIN